MVRILLKAKINPNGREVAFLELIVCESSEEGALPHRAVADYHHLEQIVVLSNHIKYIPAIESIISHTAT